MRHHTLALRLLIGVGVAALCQAPAWAQDESRQDIATQNQILELRQDVDALRAQVSSGGGAPQPVAPSAPQGGSATSVDMLPQLLDRVQQLEDQVRTLQGRADEARNALQQQNADLGKQVADLAFRVQTLEGGPAKPAEPGAPAPGPDRPPDHVLGALPSPPSPPVVGGLQGGYAALARRDYPAAEAAARQTLANPRAPRANDAQFLLAQSLSGQHKYQQAALAYDDTYAKVRRGPHAADALLGLASALAALGEKPAACATLDKLRAEFPAQRPDLHQAASGLGRRANCR